MLLKRVFPLRKLFKIGKDLGIDYFDCFKDEWEIDDDQAALEIANKINDSQIREVFDKQNPRDWVVFRGKNYTFEDGQFKVQGSWNSIRSNIRQFKEKYGKNGHEILRRLAEAGKSCDLEEIVSDFKKKIDYVSVLKELEQLKVVVVSYIGDEYQEWRVL
jgi:5-methylthioribose kinase